MTQQESIKIVNDIMESSTRGAYPYSNAVSYHKPTKTSDYKPTYTNLSIEELREVKAFLKDKGYRYDVITIEPDQIAKEHGIGITYQIEING